jgi:2,4-dienoyl-CoA reductase-like NADH-dependent reductase (Old Yellow Enzyme family)
MTSLRDPLTLPCGQILPNRIMKAALSEGLGDKRNSPDGLEQLYSTWSQGGYGLIVTVSSGAGSPEMNPALSRSTWCSSRCCQVAARFSASAAAR